MRKKITHLSVLLPTYNCEKYIRFAIKSILAQTFKDFEFLIIDDGSSDETENIVISFKDNRINYVQKEHSGLADSLNYGLSIAKYDWIARMDADDLAMLTRLEEQVKFMNENQDVDILGTWYGVFKANRLKYIVKTKTNHSGIIKRMPIQNEILHAASFFNKKLILESGGYKKRVFEDYELWIRIKDKVKFAVLPEVLMFVNFRQNSLSRENLEEKRRIIYDLQNKYYKNLGTEFGITTQHEKNSLIGWREFFYGDKNKARFFWSKLGISIISNLRLLIAFIFTFLPIRLFEIIREIKLRLILEYLLNYFTQSNRQIRKSYKKLIKQAKCK